MSETSDFNLSASTSPKFQALPTNHTKLDILSPVNSPSSLNSQKELITSTSSTDPSSMASSRIQISNIAKFFTAKDVRKWMLANKDIQQQPWAHTLKIKKSPHSPCAFVTLADPTLDHFSEVYSFLTSLNLLCKNKPVHISKAKEHTYKPNPLLKQSSIQFGDHLKEWGNTNLTPSERIAFQTTPLWPMPYENQLKLKLETIETILRKDFKKQVKDLPEFRMLPPIPSPCIEGYRSKCEFSFGLDLNKQKCIGFNAGAYLAGDFSVVSPEGLRHINETMLVACRILQEFIVQSPYPVWDKKASAGFFRLCLMRTTTTQENMFILQVDPRTYTKEDLKAFETEFKEFFVTKANEVDLKITVLGIQYYEGVHDQFSPDEPIQLLVGSSLLIHETLLDRQFMISPTSFFQINTAAAEQLYSLVRSWAQPTFASSSSSSSSPQGTLLDLCCGTGTIGLCLASSFQQVIGIEIIPSAIEDAKQNALINQVHHFRFELGSVESVLPQLLKEFETKIEEKGKNEHLVAVLNPPRNGVHVSVIRAIRSCTAIQKLIYISCNAKLASKNFVDLCRPETLSLPGPPFQPTRSVIVDMFPHTNHVETVIEFQRFKSPQDE